QSTVPRGRIVRIDTDAAKRSPGVLAVLTHENADKLPQKGMAAVDPPAGRAMSLLQEDIVHYNGQPIAVVIADTFEHANSAAMSVNTQYAPDTPVLSFQEAKRNAYPPAKAGREPT